MDGKLTKTKKFAILVLSISIIAIILIYGVFMPKYMKKNIKETWVQDVKTTEIIPTMMKLTENNAIYIHNTGSEYITGPSKSGRIDEVGIYFRDPMAT